LIALLLTLSGVDGSARAADLYQDIVQPFAAKYCVECHNQEKTRGELDLTKYSTEKTVTSHFRRWQNIASFIRDGEMPPEDFELQPTIDERNVVINAVETILLAEARRNAGDPGVVLPRRLSNTEYDLSVSHLTGVDIHATVEFPVDPAAGEGFDNTGEALSMSPSLLRKYMAAGQHVASHLVLKTDGITFAPYPVTSYNERKKLTEQAIIDFYQNHEVKILDYLEAAWRFRHRPTEQHNMTIESWAKSRGLSGRYLPLVWQTLSEASSSEGFLKPVGLVWDAVPAPVSPNDVPKELRELDQMIRFLRRNIGAKDERLIRPGAGNWPIAHLDFRAKQAALRDKFSTSNLRDQELIRFDRLKRPGNNQQTEPQTLYIRVDSAIDDRGDGFVIVQRPILSRSGDLPRNQEEAEKNQVVTLREFLAKHTPQAVEQLKFGRHPNGHEVDEDSFVIKAPALIEITLTQDALAAADNRHVLAQCILDKEHSRDPGVLVQATTDHSPADKYSDQTVLLIDSGRDFVSENRESAQRFCNAFPNRFFYVDQSRGLAAGFHLVEGFFRDDQPLVQKVLTDQERVELDLLWEEINFVTQSVETLIRGFVWFERSERHVLHDKRFDFLRAEDPRLIEDELLYKFERVYMDRLGVKLVEDELKPTSTDDDRFRLIHGFFDQIRDGLKHQRELLKNAESQAFTDLEQLAARAWRRPLASNDRDSLMSLYKSLRDQGQGVENSVRGVFTAILLSPDFFYRYTDSHPGIKVSQLSDRTIASRLSYFLWSSLPDDELLALSNDGRLRSEATLVAQTRRMLKDDRVKAIAREFFGQWLRYRDFIAKDPINAEAFPEYTDELRQAMFEEPARLLTSLIQEDRPVIDLLNTDSTFVNGTLARHYGGDIARQYQNHVADWTNRRRTRGLSVERADRQWHRVDGLRDAGRGGLFGMGVVLTQNSAGERTSPVKRGFWAVHHLLGQHFPPPPADVAELPKDEKSAPKTIRELMAEHTANPRCAMCHVHFDSLGIAMEGFDTIGRRRARDLAGRPVDEQAEFPGGEAGSGIPGLIQYIEKNRKRDFLRTLCRKFLGYALGRSVTLSDSILLEQMEEALHNNNYRFSVLFETVVTSPQFRNQRGRDFSVTNR
tara:strand:+ start:249527 stop:252907 length:3381 start_codon:yes stop_codon:yes gene_type:complete